VITPRVTLRAAEQAMLDRARLQLLEHVRGCACYG